MENLELNKKFKFNDEVYVLITLGLPEGDYSLVKGKVIGARFKETSYSRIVYSVTTCDGTFEFLPCDIYTSVEDFVLNVKAHVVQ